VPAHLRCFC